MQAQTRQGTTPAYVHHGKVLDVDTSTYRLVVATEFTKKVLSAVSFATPYQHPANGEGIYFMPEVGSTVWICEPSDGSMPFVMAWSASQEEADFRARKMGLNPGDIYLGTRDENFLILRRGGVVQIGGGPLSQRMFLPVSNTIKDLCENYELQTLGGSLEWTVKRTETDTDGARPTGLRLQAKYKANDPAPIAELEVGAHEGDSDLALTLKINASGDANAATVISLSLGKDGTVQWHLAKDFRMQVDGDTSWHTAGSFSNTSSGDMSSEAQGSHRIAGATTTIEATTGPATHKSPTAVILETPLVQAGGSTAVIPVVLGSTEFIVWLATHVHPVILPGTPTGPPITPLPVVSMLAKSLVSK